MGFPLRSVACLSFVLGCGSTLLPPTTPLRQADAIVVLGNRPPTDAAGHVMPETRRRVERGVALFHAGLADTLVMTGGPAPHGRVEAEVMRDLALSLGVPAEAVRVEPRSTDTIENARYTVALLCEGEALCFPSVIVVSTPYHLERAGHLFACAGARVQLAGTEIPLEPGYARRLAFTERVVRVYYALFDECAAASPRMQGL